MTAPLESLGAGEPPAVTIAPAAQASVSVVLPTFNERESVRLLIPRILEVFHEYDCEVLVVDDGSPDGTGGVVQDLARTHSSVRLITKHDREGIGAALRVGYDQAKGDIIVSSDADLSFEAEDLLRLAEAIQQGNDLVVGSRHMAGAAYEARAWRVRCKRWVSCNGNRILRAVFRIPIHDFSANCRAIRRTTWQQIRTQEKTNTLLLEMILRCHFGGFRVREAPVVFKDRRYGRSKLRLSVEAPKFLVKMARYRWQYRRHCAQAKGRA